MSTESSVQLADAMSDEIVASWSRSAHFDLLNEHVTPAYEPVVDGVDRLVALARPLLDRACDDLSGTRVALVLADKDARILDRRVGEGTLRAALDHVQLARSATSGASASSARTPSELRWRGAGPSSCVAESTSPTRFARLTGAAATITDPRSGQLLGVVGLLCAVEDTNALMLPYACRVAREIESRFLDDGSAAERALLEHFVRARRHGRGPIVAVNQRSMFTNAAAVRLVDEGDHELLWEWAERTVVTGRCPSEDLRLVGGTRVRAECEPVRFGTDTVGALIRMVVGPVVEQCSPRPRSTRRASAWQVSVPRSSGPLSSSRPDSRIERPRRGCTCRVTPSTSTCVRSSTSSASTREWSWRDSLPSTEPSTEVTAKTLRSAACCRSTTFE